MAVAVDAVSTAVTTSTTSASPHTDTSLTTGASLSNGAVVFVVCSDVHVTGSAATWDGVACTLVASGNNTGTNGRVEIWALSPLGAHEGNKTFSYSWTGGGAAQTMIFGTSWTGVDQTGGVTSFPNGNSAAATVTGTTPSSVTITSAVGDAVIAGFAQDVSQWLSTNNTNLYLLGNAGALIDTCANRAAGAASVAMTATPATGTSQHQIAVGVDIKAFVAAAAQTPYEPWRQRGPILAQ